MPYLITASVCKNLHRTQNSKLNESAKTSAKA